MNRLLIAGVILCIIALWLLPAFAHTAPSGWAYSSTCCSGQDCAPAPVGGVTATPEGSRVHIEPGEHPMVTGEALDWVVPYDGAVLQSGDGQFHVCVGYARNVICLYVPQGEPGA